MDTADNNKFHTVSMERRRNQSLFEFKWKSIKSLAQKKVRRYNRYMYF